MGIAAILQAFNLAAPGVIQIIKIVRSGASTSVTRTLIVTLDTADAQFAADEAEFNSELAKLGK